LQNQNAKEKPQEFEAISKAVARTSNACNSSFVGSNGWVIAPQKQKW
jgi:hypothetical protein